MKDAKKIAVVAHDNCKRDLLDFIENNMEILSAHDLIATGTTGGLVEQLLSEKIPEEQRGSGQGNVTRLKSGPLGGDQQLGALIAEGKIDILIFFWDPMQPHPHDVDVKALLRLSVLYNVPTANNVSSAEFLISSPHFNGRYCIRENDFSGHLEREVE